MKIFLTIILFVVSLVLVTPVYAIVLPYSDDFESYDTGTIPSGWNGGTVSTAQAYSPTKSFKISGSVSSLDSISFPDIFSYSAAVMVPSESTKGGSLGIAKTWGGATPVNAIEFWASLGDNGEIYWEGPTAALLLDECVRDKWYKVDVTVSGFLGESTTADISITYDSTTETIYGVAAYNYTMADGENFKLHNFSESPTMYYDDINIVPEPATLLLFGFGGLVLRAKRRA